MHNGMTGSRRVTPLSADARTANDIFNLRVYPQPVATSKSVVRQRKVATLRNERHRTHSEPQPLWWRLFASRVRWRSQVGHVPPQPVNPAVSFPGKAAIPATVTKRQRWAKPRPSANRKA